MITLKEVMEKAGGMDARTAYFKMLQLVIYRGNYLLLLSRKYNRRRNWIDRALAIFANVFVAVWIFKSDWAQVSAIVIAATHILTILKPLFGVVKNAVVIEQALIEFQAVRYQVEEDWWKIDFEDWTDKQILDAMLRIKQKEFSVFSRIMYAGIDEDEKVAREAGERAAEYVKKAFPGCS